MKSEQKKAESIKIQSIFNALNKILNKDEQSYRGHRFWKLLYKKRHRYFCEEVRRILNSDPEESFFKKMRKFQNVVVRTKKYYFPRGRYRLCQKLDGWLTDNETRINSVTASDQETYLQNCLKELEGENTELRKRYEEMSTDNKKLQDENKALEKKLTKITKKMTSIRHLAIR